MKLPKPKVRGLFAEKSIKKEDLQIERKAIPPFILFIVLILIGMTVFYYWRGKKPKEEPEQKVTIVTTIFPITDILKNVIGDTGDFEIIQLIPDGVDPQIFEAETETKDKIAQADIVIKVGAGFDDLLFNEIPEGTGVIDMSKIIELKEKRSFSLAQEQEKSLKKECEISAGIWLGSYFECEQIGQDICESNAGKYEECSSSCRHFEESDVCSQVCVPTCTFTRIDAADTDVTEDALQDNKEDPHYWLSIENAKKIVVTMNSLVVQLKPGYEKDYNENVKDYLSKLDETETYIQEEVGKLINKRIMVYQDLFLYFDEAYDIDIVYVYRKKVGKISSETYLDELMRQIEAEGLRIVYAEPYIEDLSFDEYVNSSGLTKRELDPFGGNKYTESYIDMMRYNIDSIRGTVLYD